jgi:hypothetical protein
VLTLDLVAKGFRYAEVPVRYRFRQHGRSFVRLGPYLRRVVPAVWRELRSAPSAMAAPGATTARTAPVPPRPRPMAAPVTLVAETSPSAR